MLCGRIACSTEVDYSLGGVVCVRHWQKCVGCVLQWYALFCVEWRMFHSDNLHGQWCSTFLQNRSSRRGLPLGFVCICLYVFCLLVGWLVLFICCLSLSVLFLFVCLFVCFLLCFLLCLFVCLFVCFFLSFIFQLFVVLWRVMNSCLFNRYVWNYL